MSVAVIWSDGAVDDLTRLRKFIEPHNQDAAYLAAQTILSATETISGHPQIGTSVENMIDDGDYRDLLIPFGKYGYVLRYRYLDNAVYILHIKHGKEKEFRELPQA